MPIDHTEKAFETAIEDSLLANGGYIKADHREPPPYRTVFLFRSGRGPFQLIIDYFGDVRWDRR